MKLVNDTVDRWIKESFRLYISNFKLILLPTVLIGIVLLCDDFLLNNIEILKDNQTLMNICFNILFYYVLYIGVQLYMLKIVRGENPTIKDIFSAYKIYVPAVIVSILHSSGGYLLFFIPGIIWCIMFMFCYFGVIDKKMSPINALKYSKTLTNGHKTNIFYVTFLLCILIACVCLIPYSILYFILKNNSFQPYFLLFCSIIIVPYYFLFEAVLYNELDSAHQASLQISTTEE